jgi:large subunit ribosomal protein L14e
MYKTVINTKGEGRKMSLYNIGRVCVKLAGRDAGNKCVIVEVIDDNYVMIDGATRRKSVNVKHLEPLVQIIEIKEKASHEDVKSAFDKLGIAVWDKKSKKPAERPRQVRKVKGKKSGAKAKVEVKAEKIKPNKEMKVEPKVEEKSIEEAVSSEVDKVEVKKE